MGHRKVMVVSDGRFQLLSLRNFEALTWKDEDFSRSTSKHVHSIASTMSEFNDFCLSTLYVVLVNLH